MAFESEFKEKKSIALKVQDPDPTHVGRNIVTLDRKTKEELGITSGDLVEIQGSKKTAAVVWPARAEDEGKAVIRMDNLIRHNCGVGLGEKVSVAKAEYKDAKKVVLAPTQEVRIIASGYDRVLKKTFIGRPLTKGDRVWITVFGSGFIYAVLDTNPRGIVKVTDFTQFVLKEEPIKEALEAIPKIAYEDIGGLEEQVQKVREMIELPMRHPELFRRLGIAPPKGVLLHGPPGTGKTLLAKAVANETNAHFISVTGPSIMCVSGETTILSNPGGEIKVEDLFEKSLKGGKIVNDGRLKIVELKKPAKVLGIDKDLKVSKGRITHITKLKAKTYKIKNSLDEELTVSENQPFLTLDSEGNPQWKPAKELKNGELVAIAKKLPAGKSQKLEWLKHFNPKQAITLTKDGKQERPNSATMQWQISKIKTSKQNCNLERANFVKLPHKSNPKLARFLGLMFSEGNITEDTIQFSNKEEILKEEFENLAEELFAISKFNRKKEKTVFYSTAVSLFLNKVCGIPIGKKGNYTLPKWLFKTSEEEIASFIQGFWEGDGTISKGTGAYPTVRIYSITSNALNDLNLLFRSLGIITKIRPWKTKLSNMLALEIVGNKGREIFAEKVKSNCKKYKILKAWFEKRQKKGDDLRIPNISNLLKKAKQELKLAYGRTIPESATERYISGRDAVTQRKLEEISTFLQKSKLAEKINLIKNSELAWSEITEIKQEEEQELYDLTVEPFNNFIAGNSLTVMHNSKFVGEAEERVRQIFKEAEENAPSIIFIDEIDSIAPKREEVVGEVERRVVAQLLALMDGMESRGNVIVIAATNRVNALDEALRRPGRFDREIEIGVPDKNGRKTILQIHSRGMPLAQDFDVNYYAQITHGFVGADLAALVKEAAMKSLRRYLPEMNLEEETIPPEVLERLEVKKADFDEALKDVQPSALREVMVEIPNVKWQDIGGLDEVKEELKQVVEWPLKYPEVFKKMGIKPPSGVLIYGPPGTGKTLLAKAIATESEANFISIKGPELLSKFVGESERGVRKIFRKARQVSPVIVFFDELDAMATIRDGGEFDSGVGDRVVNQILTELDGIESLKGVIFIAATNRPDLLDPAMLRPGRIDKIIFVGAPDEKAREEIFKVHLKDVPLAKSFNLKEIIQQTKGYSGADILGLVREAALMSLKESKMKPGEVSKKHFETAMQKILPSLSEQTEENYEQFRKKLTEVKLSYVG